MDSYIDSLFINEQDYVAAKRLNCVIWSALV